MKHIAIFWGKVIYGKKRGKSLGFPTANTRIHKKLPEGIFASLVKLNKKRYNAITFIGKAETFGETNISAETYILNFSANIYNSVISVRLLKKLRDNKKFKSGEDLILQMERDKKEAESYFKTYV